MRVIAMLVALDLQNRRSESRIPVRKPTEAEVVAKAALKHSALSHANKVAEAVGVRPC